MKDTMRKLEFFAPYDYDGMTCHLEQMALDGWLIEKVNGNLWKYKKIQPQKLKFAVTHFEYFTVNEAAPDNGQNEFIEMCAEADWQLAAHSKTMMVFVSDNENAIPIETDPVVQMKNIHKSVQPMLIGKNVIIAFNVIQNIAPRLQDMLQGTYQANYTGLLLFLVLFVLINIDTIDYISWYIKAKNVIKEQGVFYVRNTNKPVYVFQFIILWFILAICFAVLVWIFGFCIVYF